MHNKIVFYSLVILFITIACAPKPPAVSLEAKKEPEVAARPAPKAGWETEWEKILKEAKKEGLVVFSGPPFAELRLGLAKAFEEAYPGIRLEYTAMRSAQFSARIKTEREAGIYNWDMAMGGSFTPLVRTRQFITPIKPLLILPEVKDPKVWLNNELQFSDKEGKLVFEMAQLVRANVSYNTNLVDPSEITSYWDLVKPKWKGKIIMQDPRESGTGMNLASYWYLHPQLGLDYIKAFAANKPVLSRDFRQISEWTARGKSSLGLATSTVQVDELQKAGMPLKWAKHMKEGTYTSAAGGAISVMDKAPHPNAVTVFLNWLLTREGQTVVSKSALYPSRRVDVPTAHMEELMIPKPGVSYMNFSSEEITMEQPNIVERYKPIFAGL